MIKLVDDSVDNSALELDNVKWCSFVCDYDFDPSKIHEVGEAMPSNVLKPPLVLESIPTFRTVVQP